MNNLINICHILLDTLNLLWDPKKWFVLSRNGTHFYFFVINFILSYTRFNNLDMVLKLAVDLRQDIHRLLYACNNTVLVPHIAHAHMSILRSWLPVRRWNVFVAPILCLFSLFLILNWLVFQSDRSVENALTILLGVENLVHQQLLTLRVVVSWKRTSTITW